MRKKREGSGAPLLVLAGFFFLTKAAGGLVESYGMASFLKQVGVASLPLVFAANTLLAFFLLNLTGRLLERRNRQQLLLLLVAGGLAVTTLVRWVLPGGLAGWGLLLVAAEQLDCLIGIVFWLLAGDLYTTREGRTVFARIAAVGIAGAAAGSFLASAGAGRTPWLLPAGGVLFLLAGLVMLACRRGGAAAKVVYRRKVPPEDKSIRSLLRKNMLLRLLLLVVLVPALVKPLIEYQFSFFVNNAYPGEKGLLVFYGIFNGSFSLFMLLIHLFLTGGLLRRLGIARVMLFLPVVETLYFAAGIFFPGVLTGMLGKIGSKAVKKTLHDSARKGFMGFFPDGTRERVSLFLKGTVVRLGGVGGAGLLWLLVTIKDMRLLTVCGLVLSLAGLWASWRLVRSYRGIVSGAIAGRQLDLDSLAGEIVTPQVRERLEGWLDPADPDLALHAARFLVDSGAAGVALIAERLPAFPPEERLALFRTAAATPRREGAEVLAASPAAADPLLAAERLRLQARWRLAGYEERIRAALATQRGPLFAAGVSAACNSGEDELFDAGVTVLKALLEEDPAAAAAVMARLENPVMEGLLRYSLRHEDGRVVRAALRALAGYPGADVIPEVRELLTRQEPDLRLLCLPVLGAVGSREAAALLLPRLAEPGRSMEQAARAALMACGSNALPVLLAAVERCRHLAITEAALAILEGFADRIPIPRERLLAAVHRRAALTADGLRLCEGGGPAFALLLRHFREEADLLRTILVRVLALGRAEAHAGRILKGLASEDRAEAALAVELVEALSPSGDKKRILSYFEGERLPAGGNRTLAALLTDLIRFGSLEGKSLAIYAIGQHGNSAFRPLLERVLAGRDPGLCGLALSAQRMLETRRPLMREELSVIDRVLFLEKVPIFAKLSVRELTAIARITEEVRHTGGKAVFREHDAAEDMYLIVEGQVRIVKGTGAEAVELALLSRGECFGEMALFERAARSATATAVGGCRLLRLGGYDFEQIMLEYPAISINICRVFSLRLRETNELLRA